MLQLIQTTVADAAQANSLARQLVEQRLAACVQAIPIRSTYRWKGEIEQNEEILLLIKTTDPQVEPLKQFLAAEHPYEVPEIVQISIDDVSAPYAQWARGQTSGNG